MSEIKKLGFGLMRLPQKSVNGADIDIEQFKKMAPYCFLLPRRCGTSR